MNNVGILPLMSNPSTSFLCKYTGIRLSTISDAIAKAIVKRQHIAAKGSVPHATFQPFLKIQTNIATSLRAKTS